MSQRIIAVATAMVVGVLMLTLLSSGAAAGEGSTANQLTEQTSETLNIQNQAPALGDRECVNARDAAKTDCDSGDDDNDDDKTTKRGHEYDDDVDMSCDEECQEQADEITDAISCGISLAAGAASGPTGFTIGAVTCVLSSAP